MDRDPRFEALGITAIGLLKVSQLRLHSQGAADRLLRFILTFDAAAKQSRESARSPLDDSAVGDNGPDQAFPDRVLEPPHLDRVLEIRRGASSANFRHQNGHLLLLRDGLFRSQGGGDFAQGCQGVADCTVPGMGALRVHSLPEPIQFKDPSIDAVAHLKKSLDALGNASQSKQINQRVAHVICHSLAAQDLAVALKQAEGLGMAPHHPLPHKHQVGVVFARARREK